MKRKKEVGMKEVQDEKEKKRKKKKKGGWSGGEVIDSRSAARTEK